MTAPSATACATRDSVLRLLSRDEVARLSNVETAPILALGDEYLDLDRIDQGVQTVHPLSRLGAGRALPRGGVDPTTWIKILALLG